MSFGFAVSDVLDLANNCHKLYRGIKETPSNLASVRESLNNLTDVLAQVQESMNERHPESDIRGNEKKSQALDSALSSCADSLKKFEVILKKYAVMEQKRPRKRDRLFSRSGLMFTLIEAKAIPGIQQELMVHLQVLGSLQHYFHGAAINNLRAEISARNAEREQRNTEMQDILRQIQDVIFQENSEPQKVGDTRNTATQKNAINCGVLSVDNAGRNVIQAQDDNLKPNCKVILPASNPKNSASKVDNNNALSNTAGSTKDSVIDPPTSSSCGDTLDKPNQVSTITQPI